MCDPFTLAMGAMAAGGALFGGGGKSDAPAPPPVIPPAQAASKANTSNADVKLGDGAAATLMGDAPTFTGFEEKRTTAKSLGGLGRGGLGL